MRQIKFRAWDRERRCWLKDFAVSANGDLLTWNESEKRYRAAENRGLTDLQQFTGFYDFNGKELYEGDIIKHTYFNIKGVAEICWSDDEACFLAVERNKGRVVLRSNCEILGNIHENPELLEK